MRDAKNCITTKGETKMLVTIKTNPLPPGKAGVDFNNTSDNGKASLKTLRGAKAEHLERIARDGEFTRDEATQKRAVQVLEERAKKGDKEAKQALVNLAKTGINPDKREASIEENVAAIVAKLAQSPESPKSPQ
jgi:hypothetical protein